MTTSLAVALVAVVVAAAGLAVGVMAARAARRAAELGREAVIIGLTSADLDREQRSRDVEPHFYCAPIAGNPGSDGLNLHVTNTGGAIVLGYILLTDDAAIFSGSFALAAQCTAVAMTIPRQGGSGDAPGRPRLELVIGQDIDQQWHDLKRGERIAAPPDLESPPFFTWMAKYCGVVMPATVARQAPRST